MQKFALLVAALLTLAGCATANFQTQSSPNATGIAGAPVYVYSMLDLRQGEFGPGMVAAVNNQIVARLNERGVPAEIIGFRETPSAMRASLVGSTYLPMERIVSENCEAEQRLGARYRLLIIPSSITISEAAHNYEVNWHLIDTATGRPVWRTMLTGSRVVWYAMDEAAESRAAAFVDGAIEEMSRSGLFEPAPSATSEHVHTCEPISGVVPEAPSPK